MAKVWPAFPHGPDWAQLRIAEAFLLNNLGEFAVAAGHELLDLPPGFLWRVRLNAKLQLDLKALELGAARRWTFRFG